ncbi:MAG: hypothetical protein QT03_C0001G0153 [archaeon GW2011_AR10]|uniref:DUF4350 domain-containing protein n=1 Tax=Candidatus Iainarchaeum sp. TaxID=3101447 RepID=A0A7J4ISI4_9ARCH|nr:MAG: hypothetical protein QT03_C0001G0153 [archaeon GW2011_AR10]HIH08481.1 hypothetical protein [Candidatus Diapherotrites archaeon]
MPKVVELDGETRNLAKDLYHVGILIALILGLWFVVSWIFGCDVVPVPFSCDAFWGILRWAEGGKARVLIVYGDGGLGNYQLLRDTFSDPTFLSVRPQTLHVQNVSIGNLRQYDMVIVTEARQISSEKLEVFIDYIAGGGRLVWTGDAGTELAPGDRLLYEYERPGGSDENIIVSPWARKIGERVVALDEFLSVDYLGNFCQLKTCTGVPYIGIFEAPNRNHEFVNGLRPDLKMYGDFAVVKARSGGYSTIVLNVDFQSDLIADTSQYYPSIIPEPSALPECNDDIDNDRDGKTDYPDDRECDSFIDDSEDVLGGAPILEREPQCKDLRDNDNDGLVDYPFDPCCVSALHDNESGCSAGYSECSDGFDNDSDGFTDYPEDADCASASDRSEGKRNLGRFFPVVVTSGLGEKVVYYATPPEFFVSEQMPIDPETGQRIKYYSLIENMYYGMLS